LRIIAWEFGSPSCLLWKVFRRESGLAALRAWRAVLGLDRFLSLDLNYIAFTGKVVSTESTAFVTAGIVIQGTAIPADSRISLTVRYHHLKIDV